MLPSHFEIHMREIWQFTSFCHVVPLGAVDRQVLRASESCPSVNQFVTSELRLFCPIYFIPGCTRIVRSFKILTCLLFLYDKRREGTDKTLKLRWLQQVAIICRESTSGKRSLHNQKCTSKSTAGVQHPRPIIVYPSCAMPMCTRAVYAVSVAQSYNVDNSAYQLREVRPDPGYRPATD